jgi:hypothetical protein
MRQGFNARTQKRREVKKSNGLHEEHPPFGARFGMVRILFAVLLPKTLPFWQSFSYSSFPSFPFVKIVWLRLCRAASLHLRDFALNSSRFTEWTWLSGGQTLLADAPKLS